MLTDQLQQLQNRLDTGKAMNAYYRKHKTLKGFPGMSDETAAQNDAAIQSAYSWAQKPCLTMSFPACGARSSGWKPALPELDSRAARQTQPAENTKFDGGEIVPQPGGRPAPNPL